MSNQNTSKTRSYDVIIIGAGIAGLSAALWLARYRCNVLVVSAGPPRNYTSHALHGYPGYEGENPAVLLEKVYKEACSYGVTIVDAWVGSVTRQPGGFNIVASGVEYQAKRLLIATGVVDEKPDIPEFDNYEGISIWHCPACDGFEYTNKKIAVVGWGPQLAGYAQEFLRYSKDVVVVTHGYQPQITIEEMNTLQSAGVKVLQSSIARLNGESGQLRSLLLDDGATIGCDGIFYSIKRSPRLELLRQLGCGLRQDGSVKINRKQETTVRGAYAAGDIAPLEELAIVAAATGAVAASNIHKSLK